MKRFSAFGVSPLLLFVCLCAGCADDPGLTMTGKVTVDGAPLTQGEVTFHSDGAETALVRTAALNSEGQYTMVAPAGKYKVTVFAEEPRSSDGADAYALPKYLVAAPFRSPDSTPLTVEVKADAAANAYDFEVSKN